jgi:hypothetical protein
MKTLYVNWGEPVGKLTDFNRAVTPTYYAVKEISSQREVERIAIAEMDGKWQTLRIKDGAAVGGWTGTHKSAKDALASLEAEVTETPEETKTPDEETDKP